MTHSFNCNFIPVLLKMSVINDEVCDATKMHSITKGGSSKIVRSKYDDLKKHVGRVAVIPHAARFVYFPHPLNQKY